jgi:hypothetical protein
MVCSKHQQFCYKAISICTAIALQLLHVRVTLTSVSLQAWRQLQFQIGANRYADLAWVLVVGTG